MNGAVPAVAGNRPLTFQFTAEILKAEEREGRPFITIYATDTGVDRHQERCSEECLLGMQSQIRGGIVDLLNTHADGVGFGKAVDANLVDAGQFDGAMAGQTALLADVELDPEFPQSKKLFDAAREGTSNHQFSIGGRINRENPRAVFYEKGIKVLNDVNLDHITVTRNKRASNPRTRIASAVFKSLDVTEDDLFKIFGDAPVVTPPAPTKDDKVTGIDAFREIVGMNVAKGITSAYFEGETAPAGEGDEEHVHRFTARLNGESGMLMGMTTSFSAGERHAHMIDLINDDATETSGPSRGMSHTHDLEMPTVRAITQEEFKTLVKEGDSDMADTLLEKEDKQTVTTTPAVDAASTTDAPVKTEESTAPAAETTDEAPEATEDKVTAPDLQLKSEEMSFLRKFVNFFGGGEKNAPQPGIADWLKQISVEITPGSITGENIGEISAAAIGLLQKIAEAEIDRDAVSVRTDKMLKVIDAVTEGGDPPDVKLGKVEADNQEPEAGAEETDETPANETETKTDDAPADDKPVEKTADSDDDELENEDMKPEQIAELGKAIGTAVVEGVVPAITASMTDTFRKEGLLPAKTDAPATDAPAEEPKTDAAPATADAPATDAPKTDAPPEAPKTDAPADKPVEKEFKDVLLDVSKSIVDIGSRLAALEGQPQPSRTIAGNDGAPRAKTGGNGVFSGALGIKPPPAK